MGWRAMAFNAGRIYGRLGGESGSGFQMVQNAVECLLAGVSKHNTVSFKASPGHMRIRFFGGRGTQDGHFSAPGNTARGI